jgi:hypothetical protein
MTGLASICGPSRGYPPDDAFALEAVIILT